MPILTIPNNFQPQTKIYSAEVNANFAAVTTLLNTTGLDNTNIQNNGINPLTKLDASAGAANQILRKVGSALAWSDEQTTLLTQGIINIAVAASVASSALTISLTQQDGTALSSSEPGYIAFRSSTATSGNNAAISLTAPVSVVVSSGSTLGTVSATASHIFVYAINNSGSVEVAVSSSFYSDGTIVSTTAEGGAGAADSATAIYSTTARSNVPLKLIGKLLSTQTTAGTWAVVPTEVVTCAYSNNNKAHQIGSTVFSSTLSNDTGSYAALSPACSFSPTITVSGKYRVTFKNSVSLQTQANYVRVNAVSGSPATLFTSQVIASSGGGGNCPFVAYSIYFLVAGSSYTFQLEAYHAAGGSTTQIRCDLVPGQWELEQID